MPDDEHIITTQWGSKARSFAALSEDQRRVRMQNCADLMDDIKQNTGIDVYLSYGCLLGAVRSGKMISHDFDIDLGFHVEASTKKDVVKECRRLLRYLSKTCHRVIVESNGQFKAAKMFADNIYMTIEFFVSWAVEDEFFLYFGIPGAPIAGDMLPFGRIEIEGVSLPAPNNPELMVEAIYGPNWRTPDPNFKYDNIDWGPFQGFSVRTNLIYWDDYYSAQIQNNVWAEYPSQFAAFCASEIDSGSKMLEFGCGNGRDSLFLSQIGHDVLACDYSQTAVDFVKAKSKKEELTLKFEVFNIYNVANVQKFENSYPAEFDVIYSRFVMHAITLEGQDRFLRMAKLLLKPEGKVLLEFRNSNDERKEKRSIISWSKLSDGHYRRFIKTDEFINNVMEAGLSVTYVAEGTGFAKFKNEDPDVTRLILKH